MKNYSMLVLAFWLCAISILTSTNASAQYGNEWIAATGYDKTYYKFKTNHNGLHRIPQSTLAAAGISLNGANFKVFSRGQELPIYVSTSGTMASSDYIEFYGEANDGYFDTQLYADPGNQANPYFSNFEDEGTFFVVSDPAGNGLRFDQTSNDLTNVPAKETYFMYESVEDAANTFHFGKPKTGVGSTSSFTADFGIGEGFCTSTISYLEVGGTVYNSKKMKVPTPGATTAGGTQASVTTRVIGKNQSSGVYFDKDFDIKVNGTTYVHAFGSDPNVSTDLKLHGYETKDYDFNLPISQLDAEETEVYFHVYDGQGSSGFPFETEISVGYVNITYPRNFNFQGETNFKFDVEVPSTKYFEITNFSGGTAPVVYDLTSNKRITPTVTSGVYKFKLAPTGDLNRTIVISSTSSNIAVETVTSLSAREFQDVTSPANQGDYVIIYHESLTEGCGIDQIQRYIDYRSSVAGGAYQVAAYEIEDLYDQFAHGIDKHGMSIKQFINYAVDNWNPEAEIVNLIGKGVQYNLYRYNQEAEDACLVPSYGNKASDLMLTSRTTTGFAPQVAVGRLPVFTCDQIDVYLDKLQEYELLYNAPCDREARSWMNDALHIAKGWYDETDSFLADLETYEGMVTENLLGMDVVATLDNDGPKISSQDCDTYVDYFEQIYNDQQQVRPHLENGLNMINYVGHSIYQNWQYDIGYPEDYDNEGKYPFILSNSCFVGKINEYNLCNGSFKPSMAEEWVLADNHGAIGFLAAVALSTPSFLEIYTTELLENLGTEPLYAQPIGLSVQQTVLDLIFQIQTNQLSGQDAEAAEITCYEFTYCGDPGVRLYSFENAEFDVVQSDVSVSSTNINSAIDNSYTVSFEYHNIGRNVAGPIPIEITQTAPNGTVVYTNIFNIENPVSGQTYTFTVPVTSGDNDGQNIVRITADPNNQFTEDCEDNNSVSLAINVTNPACSGNESAEFSFANTSGAANSLCIDDALEVSFDGSGAGLVYDFGTGANVSQSGLDFSVAYTTPGVKTITFTVGTGDCLTTETQQVNVVEPLAAPVLECVQNSEGILTINWTAISGVNAYFVRINGGSPTIATSPTASEFGVAAGESVTFEVQASGSNACGTGPSASITCTAQEQECTPPTVTNLNNISICEGETASLTAQPAGGVYSLDGSILTSTTISDLTVGTYNVAYEVGEEGCKGTASATITVTDVPTVSNLNNIVICEGETATLAAQPVGGTYTLDGTTVSGTTLSNLTEGTYTVAYEVGSDDCKGTASATITVTDVPTVSNLNNISICEGETASLAAQPAGGTYTLDGTTVSGTTLSNLTEGTYTVAYEVGSDDCKGTASATITVTDIPTVSNLNNIVICEGETATLAAQPAGGTYTLDGTTVSGTTLSNLTEGTYMVAYEVGGDDCKATESAMITVNAEPTVEIEGDLQICAGETGSLAAVGDFETIVWDAANNNSTISISEAGTYTATVTNASGCNNSASVTVTIAEPQDVQISGNTTVCDGETSTLLLSETGLSNITWNTDETGTSIDVTDAGTYSATYIDANGCNGSATVVVEESDNSNPQANFALNGNTSICAGESISLQNNSTNSSGFEWIISNDNTGTSTNSNAINPIVTLTNEGTYTVSLRAFGCGSNENTTVSTALVTVEASPVASANQVEDCDEATGIGQAIITPSGGATYIVSGDANLSVANGNSFTVPEGSNISIVAVSPAGCESEAIAVDTAFDCEIAGPDCTNFDINVTASNLNPCEGDVVTLTASGGSSYAWAGVATSSGNTATITSSTSISVNGSNVEGCSGSDALNITFIPKPEVNYTISNATPCVGETISVALSGATSYNFNGAEDSFDGTTATFVVSEDFTINIQGTANGCSADLVTIPITVVDEIVVAYSVSNPNPCPGEVVAINVSGAESYDFGGANVDSFNGITALITVNEDIVFTVQGGSSNGCEGELVSIPINVGNNIQLSYSVSNPTPCIGETVTIDVSGAANYDFAGTIDAFDGNTASILVTNNTTISLQGSTGNCESEVIAISLEVQTPPNLQIAGDLQVCEGSEAELILIGSGVSDISWNNGATGFTSIVTSAGTYTATYVDNDSGCIGSTSVFVGTYDEPDVQISGDITICEGSETMLTLSGDDISNIAWSNGQLGATAIFNAAGTYNVTYNDENGCNRSSFLSISSFDAPSISINGNTEICEGEMSSVNLVGDGLSDIVWDNGNMNTLNTTEAGIYTASYIDANGCDREVLVTISASTDSNPIAGFALGSNANLCIGGFATFQNNSQNSSASEWTITNTTTGNVITSNDFNPSISLSEAGVYSVSLKALGCGTNENEISQANIITVEEGPAFEVVSLDCEAGQLILTGTDVVNYAVSGDVNEFVNGSENVIISFNPFVNGESVNITINATGTNGCIRTSGFSFDCEAPIDCNSIVINAEANVDCNEEQELIDLILASTEAVSFTINLTNETIDVVDGTAIFESIPAQTAFTVIATNINGCTYEVYNTDGLACTTTGPDCTNIDVALEASSFVVCEGETVTVSASGADSYSWSTGTPNAANAIEIEITETTTITVTDADGCNSSDAIVIEFEPTPTVSYTLSNPTPCEGETVTISVEGAENFTWGDISLSGASVEIEAVDGATYSVMGTSANGCTSEMIEIPISATATVDLAVSLDGSAIESGETINTCGAGSLSLSVPNAADYSWNTGVSVDGETVTINYNEGTNAYSALASVACANDFSFIIESEANPSLDVQAAAGVCVGETIEIDFAAISGADYTVSEGLTLDGSSATATITENTQFTISYTTASGCSGEETFEVLAYAQPTATAISNAETVCIDGSFTLSVEEVAGNTYNWTGANIENVNAAAIEVMATDDMIGDLTYMVEVISAEGCSTSSEVSVSVQDIPDLAAFTANNEQIACAGEDYVIEAQSEFGTISWEGAGITGETAESVTVNIAEPQTITVYSTNEFGCARSLSFDIDVYSDGTALTVPQSSSVCSFSSIPLELQDGAVAYVADNADGVIETLDDGTQILSVLDTAVEVFIDFNDENGCYKNGSFTITSDDSLCEELTSEMMPNVISPNGDSVNDTWDIEQYIARYPDNTLLIYNRWGEKIYEASGYTNAWDGTRNGNDLSDGTYYYLLFLEDTEDTIISGTITIIR